VYNALATLPISWGRVVVEITLLNAAAVGFTQLLRVYILRRGWTKLSIPELVPRSLLTSVLLGLVFAGAMHFMAVAPLWGLGSITDPAHLDAIPALLRSIGPFTVRTLNWSLAFFIWISLYISITSVRDRHAAELRQSELTRALQAEHTAFFTLLAVICTCAAFALRLLDGRARHVATRRTLEPARD
jgi:hypothetical protein